MFRKLLTLTTMTSVVLHALLGCCVHHAHADHAACHHVETVTASAQDGHHHGHGHAHHHGHDHSDQNESDHGPSCVCDDCSSHDCSGDDPCSGSHGPHDSCDEPNCNIVADQRDNGVTLFVSFDWSPLLTCDFLLSAQDATSLRTEAGSPPDPHAVLLPLRVKTQVWRI